MLGQKKLASILSVFEKTKTELTNFVASTNDEIKTTQDKLNTMTEDVKQANAALEQVNKILGK